MSPRSNREFYLPAGPELEGAAEQLYREGFVLLKQVLPVALIKELQDELELVSGAVAEDSRAMISFDADDEVLSLHGLDKYSEMVFDVTREPALIGLAEGLLRQPAIPFLTEYFAKPSAGAAATPPHQDQVFYNSHFDDELAITFWCPLTEVTLDDAPLEYGRPATDLWNLLPHGASSAPNFSRELAEGFPPSYVPVPASPGDIVVHHAFAVHRTRVKSGEGPRQAFAMNFRSSPVRRPSVDACV